jgi:hypothetical protein
MKRLMTMMLALSFVLGSVAVVFAQDTTDTTKTAKKAKKAKKAPAKDTSKTGR